MTIEYFDVTIIFGKEIKENNQIIFKCPYNNQTNFNDLFEIISLLFPEQKLCLCFKYEIKNKTYFISINKNDNIKEYINSIKPNNIILKIYKENYKCICELNYQEYEQKSKKEVIDNLLNSYKKINNYINENEKLKKENKNYKNDLERFKNFLNNFKKNNDSLKIENENYKKELEKVNNDLSEYKKNNDPLKNEIEYSQDKIKNKGLNTVSNNDFDYINKIHGNKITNIEFKDFYDVRRF